MYQQSQDPGLGEKYFDRTRRIINHDGSFNIKKTGGGLKAINAYHYLINITWLKFISLVLAAFILINILFASVYVFTGITGISSKTSDSFLDSLMYCYFFSVQTFSTVGYGVLTPSGLASNFIASFEAMIGILCYAFATGLLYGRFSRPSARIIFSENALIAPYRNINALEFRIANQRSNVLLEMEARVMLSFVDKNNPQKKRNYYNLNLEIPFVFFFPLPWTIVHPIDADSPLNNKTKEELDDLDAEILVLIKGYDDSFSQQVHAKNSYRFDEIEWDAVFLPAFYTNDFGETIVELEKINHFKHMK